MKKNTIILAIRGVLAAVCLLIPFTFANAQSSEDLREGYPDRYVVQEGDTLWDIANKYLNDPWRWPLIWQANENIENPHLIFPGDLLVVTSDYRIKAVRLEPAVHVQPLDRAIPTIPPQIIEPFLTAAIIVDPGELEKLGHVVAGVDDELVMGKFDDIYARNLGDLESKKYRIFRAGKSLMHPETGELLGIEGIHVGEAEMVRWGDTARLHITSAVDGVVAGDRLAPIEGDTPLPYYLPRAPETDISGWVLYAPQGVREVGKFDIVIISGGSEDGLEEGHVIKALYHRGMQIDPVTKEEFRVPDEVSGLLLVVKVFDKLSYALVGAAIRQIALGDTWATP